MKLAIMQPYFLPYIGYWQLLAAVDQFVLYDNIQFTKRGWINRNRFLRHGEPVVFTIPVDKGAETQHVVERSVAASFEPHKLLNQLRESYRHAPQFSTVFPLVESIVTTGEGNLFRFIHNSIRRTAAFLDISTPIVISSTVDIDHGLRGEEKVLALCRAMGASTYINPIGGQTLYSRETFLSQGIQLQFLRAGEARYAQYDAPFVENLSILDVMMFNSPAAIRDLLCCYQLL